mmetsp:Transcript_3663/g.8042  ORF Transcript_3663/g.8042 Transcript_3663/m.8042 type:complete len:89 (-) Transcript_3663:102-368(-)
MSAYRAPRRRDFTERVFRFCSRTLATFSLLGVGYFSVMTMVGVWNTAQRRRERAFALAADFEAEMEAERIQETNEGVAPPELAQDPTK